MTWQEMNTAPKGGAMPMSMTNDPPVGGSAPAPPPESERVKELASRLLDMLERVEWVRAAGGKSYVCPFCSGVSERSGGPGHQDDCEGEMVRREGNELRHAGGLL
jgi:hypothetical protein